MTPITTSAIPSLLGKRTIDELNSDNLTSMVNSIAARKIKRLKIEKKTVSFDTQKAVYTIPSRKEYEERDISRDIWMDKEEVNNCLLSFYKSLEKYNPKQGAKYTTEETHDFISAELKALG